MIERARDSYGRYRLIWNGRNVALSEWGLVWLFDYLERRTATWDEAMNGRAFQ